jgi:hypothetical protein
MKHSAKFFPGWPAESAGARKTEQNTERTGRHVTLSLLEDRPHQERGYNPYNTIAHAREIHQRDVWRHKPKRA